jgi:hypothetical protein
MDILGLSSKESTAKQWAGEKGIPFLDWAQLSQNDQSLVRSSATGRGLLCSASMMIERLLTRIKRHTIGEKDVHGLTEDLQDLLLAADLIFGLVHDARDPTISY